MNEHPNRPTIVVGVDGSPQSILALRWAVVLAPIMGAGIRAVTAWEFDIPFGRLTPAVQNPDHIAQQVCSSAVEQGLGAANSPAVEQVIRQGPAAKVLIDETRQAQLLILGSRGHGGFEGLLMGSVSTSVAEHAKCPVLVAHGAELPPALSATPPIKPDPAAKSQTPNKGENDA
ncbi:universal stress protein [Arthrobacter pascens]|uniref:universal stress protein n=1 Tax=Arthrobacter pascens TaxID=1677 RepID=UPI00196B6B36|nr:universal stress protein [Arthrobacter pascens]MBN3498725.1 universal stress protein [Arthrobacter pascens]MDR6556691.1 nucleotide-binding universal stress UspA family protein [Arthrobacter pascens]